MSNYFVGFANKELVTGAKTLDEGDGGVVQYVTTTATVTLPAAAIGRQYIVAQAPGAVATISPNAADKIMGAGLTSADDKDLIGPADFGGTAYVILTGNADGWNVGVHNGTWTRQS